MLVPVADSLQVALDEDAKGVPRATGDKTLFRSALTRYSERWAQLLEIEELQHAIDLREYDMLATELDSLAIVDDGWTGEITVPGLSEGRPAVLVGDLVRLRQSVKVLDGRVAGVDMARTATEIAVHGKGV